MDLTLKNLPLHCDIFFIERCQQRADQLLFFSQYCRD